jgi:hypothetical protein
VKELAVDHPAEAGTDEGLTVDRTGIDTEERLRALPRRRDLRLALEEDR